MATDRDPAGAGAPDPQPDPLSLRSRYQESFEFAQDGQLVTDAAGVILEANHAAAALLRCAKEFLPGKPLGLFVAAGYRARFYERLVALARAAEIGPFETRLGRPGDEPRDALVRATHIDGPAGPVVLRWVVRDVTDLRRSEATREDLLRRLLTAQEDERRRVARELHDSAGQLLTALTLAIRSVRDAAPLPVAASDRLAHVQRIAEDLGRALHDLAIRLRPAALDDLGLDTALAQHVADWADRAGVLADYQGLGLGGAALEGDVETAIFRLVQEALTNVARHAGAGRVSVVVAVADGRVAVVVEDDGAGFDPAAVPPGRLGLAGLRERVGLVGGTFEVESRPGGGTAVLARFPLPAR